MNGADRLCDVLLANGVNVCFANPGTSEMHFVAALDRKPQMRCVLGLSEGVVTGAADGYARMADKPAATLLHLGPGLANGLANLHNARRASTPMLNIVGDHATQHLAFDAPLTSDIDSLARPMSNWVGRIARSADIRSRTEEAYRAAMTTPGIATLVLHADAAWGNVETEPLEPLPVAERSMPQAALIGRAADALKAGDAALFLGGRAMRADALEVAGRIAEATGAQLFTERAARWQRGAGRVAPRHVPYRIEHALETLKNVRTAILVGGREPVGFFAYPGKPGRLLPEQATLIELAGCGDDLPGVLEALADAVGAGAMQAAVSSLSAPDLARPSGRLDPDAISVAIARALPEDAVICEESITSAGRLATLAPTMVPHDHLPLTGGSIGIGIPLATGAAIGAPGRKVVCLQADGSGMYTLQGLWTQARECLDVTTVVFSNRGYAILKGEMRNVGVDGIGANARRMLEIDDPALDWVSLARGMGVEGARAETAERFADIFEAAMSRTGPFLIEAVI